MKKAFIFFTKLNISFPNCNENKKDFIRTRAKVLAKRTLFTKTKFFKKKKKKKETKFVKCIKWLPKKHDCAL